MRLLSRLFCCASISFLLCACGPSASDKQGMESANGDAGNSSSASSPAEMVSRQAKGFVVGSSGPIITVFSDPNCVHCNHLYKNLMPHIAQGKLRVRFVLVGFLAPSSTTRAATILGAKDPAQALSEDEAKYETGGIAVVLPVRPDLEKQIRANTKLLADSGEISTPAILLCAKGIGPEILYGAPSDISTLLASLDLASPNPSCSRP
jgi:thiol:disulfide interchange protein DsbG